jgi:hypothetical protein
MSYQQVFINDDPSDEELELFFNANPDITNYLDEWCNIKADVIPKFIEKRTRPPFSLNAAIGIIEQKDMPLTIWMVEHSLQLCVDALKLDYIDIATSNKKRILIKVEQWETPNLLMTISQYYGDHPLLKAAGFEYYVKLRSVTGHPLVLIYIARIFMCTFKLDTIFEFPKLDSGGVDLFYIRTESWKRIIAEYIFNRGLFENTMFENMNRNLIAVEAHITDAPGLPSPNQSQSFTQSSSTQSSIRTLSFYSPQISNYEENTKHVLFLIPEEEEFIPESGIIEPVPVIKQDPVIEQSPVIEPVPVIKQDPVIEQSPVIEPVPVIKQDPGIEQSPVIEPVPVIKQSPVIEPVPVIKQNPVIEPVPVIKQNPVIEPVPVIKQNPVIEPVPLIDELVPPKRTRMDRVPLFPTKYHSELPPNPFTWCI